jgi:glutamine amidotransferase
MNKKHVAIIDYGLGNVWSVISAFKYLGAEVKLVSAPDKVSRADLIVLPGVGSFNRGMEELKKRRLDVAIQEAVVKNNSKIFGICLGMQLLGSYGTEDGKTEGLGLVANRVDRFTQEELGVDNKIPHVGFNQVWFNKKTGLFNELPDNADFYFTHSYRMLQEELTGRIGLCSYGTNFLAAFEIDNICGTQFHPEKSQTNGLILLRNFLNKK